MTDIIPSITVHPGELTEHPLNSNSHNRQNLEELAESRKQFGQFKNVVVYSPKEPLTVTLADGSGAEMKPGIMYVIAGNGFHQASILRNDEAIEVKDVSHLSHEDALSLMEADNASPLGSSPKLDQMLANMEIVRQHKPDNERLQGMLQRARELRGVSLNGNDDEGAGENYSRNIEPPEYVPTGDKPEIEALFDRTRAETLIKAIDENDDITEQEKEFLRHAARRHTVFDFRNIAEYYAHSNEAMQTLMEDSALVIIDFQKAISLGFVQLTKEIAEMVRDEYGD